MIIIKRIVSLLLLFVFLFAFAACTREDEPPSIYEDATVAITPPGKIPSDAKTLAELDNFNGEKAVFAYRSGTFYALIGDPNKEMSKAEEVLSGITVKQRLLTYSVSDVNEALVGGESTLLMTDMDFDGHSDIGLIQNSSKDGKQYICWLWDHASKSFNYSGQLSALVNINIDVEKKAIRGITYVNGEAVENVYRWVNRKLSRINEEDLTEKPAVTVEETNLKTAFKALYGAEPTVKETGNSVINRNNVTLFDATANNKTTKFAVTKTGVVFIDELGNGNYKKILTQNGQTVIGESVTSQYNESQFTAFAMQLAAKEVGEQNVTKATRTDTSYADKRLVYVYTVTIFNGSGTMQVAMDDTMTHYYYVDTSGKFSADLAQQTTIQQATTAVTPSTTQAPVTTTQAPTTVPTTQAPTTLPPTTISDAVG